MSGAKDPGPRSSEGVASARALTIAIVGVTLACVAAAVALVQGGDQPVVRVLDAAAEPGVADVKRTPPTLSAPKTGTGPHTLSGEVVDVSGAPVVGAVITADFRLGPGIRGKPAAPGLVLSPEVATRSLAGGAFSLVGLEPGRYRLHIAGADVFPAEVRFVEAPAEKIRIVVSRKVDVSGRVVSGIEPVAGATIHIWGGALEDPVDAITDEHGQFEATDLPGGTLKVWAVDGARNLASPAMDVARLGPGPFDPLVLSMVPAHRIGGRVVDGDGRGIEGATVMVRDAGGDEPARHATSGEDGQFEVAGLLPGNWIAQAHAPGYVSGGQVRFAADREHSLTLTAFQGGQISGSVVGPDGGPVEGAVIAAYLAVPGGGHREVSAASQALRADASKAGTRLIPRGELGVLLGPIPFPPPPGKAQLRVAVPIVEGTGPAPPDTVDSAFVTDERGHFRVAGLSPGTYRVVAKAPDLATGRSRAIEVHLGETETGVRIALPRGVMIEGDVRDGAGNPIPGAIVEWEPAKARLGQTSIAALADDRGRYRLGPVTGRVVLTASAHGYGRARRQVTATSTALLEQDFVLSGSESRIFGQVLEPGGFPLAGARVVARSRHGQHHSATTGEHGRFSIAGVPAGAYSLRITHADYPPARASADTDVASSVVMAFGGGISGQVREAQTGAAIPGATLVLDGPGKSSRKAVTDDRGEFGAFPLAAGRWTVVVDAPGFAPAKTTVEVEAGNRARRFTVDDLRVELSRGAIVAGTVRDGWGELCAGAVVYSGGVRTKTDVDGRFRLEDVPAGEITVVFEHENARSEETVTVLPGDELATLDLRLPRPAD